MGKDKEKGKNSDKGKGNAQASSSGQSQHHSTSSSGSSDPDELLGRAFWRDYQANQTQFSTPVPETGPWQSQPELSAVAAASHTAPVPAASTSAASTSIKYLESYRCLHQKGAQYVLQI
ncbi:hypothetical protein PG994_007565 [Apiospora phragmitis]|uniref:Uncharacterized protein n=1 Tax=Apiospora phragmitis TaxID=2905665 RepID=A0ABR1V1W9_9PEZI